MKLEIKNLKLNKINAPYPIGYIDNFLEEKDCNKLFKEIYAFESYDDLVMNGRMRVNKGSKNFDDYLKNSPNLLNLYQILNNKNLFDEMKEKLSKINSENSWTPQLDEYIFSKSNYGEQEFNLFKYLRKSWLISKLFKKTVNLDIDFSRSKKGYFRKPHRDRDTRIISFLLYLNTIEKNLGGEFEIYKLKEGVKKFNRFPQDQDVDIIDKFSPKAGQFFIFISSPDSYHGVSKFLSESKDRVFIYGSYSLDRKVNWKTNGKLY